jgi:hypothetical protein
MLTITLGGSTVSPSFIIFLRASFAASSSAICVCQRSVQAMLDAHTEGNNKGPDRPLPQNIANFILPEQHTSMAYDEDLVDNSFYKTLCCKHSKLFAAAAKMRATVCVVRVPDVLRLASALY